MRTTAEVLAVLDAHHGVELRGPKKAQAWCCRGCGSELTPWVDFKPIDNRLHTQHLAEVIAAAVDQAITNETTGGT